jgi:deoxyadenosine/deoxycytidine kinase
MIYNSIAIEGNIGVGKTTLAKKLAKDTGANVVLEEFNENPFLPRFYDNREKYAFPLELSFLAQRYKQLKNLFAQSSLFMPLTISDYHLTKSLVFAKINLDDEYYTKFRSMFYILYHSVPKPDLMVYLNSSLDNILKNIHSRSRPYEKTIEKKYLQKIHDAYLEFFRQNNDIRVLVLDLEHTDIVHTPGLYNNLYKEVIGTEYPRGLTRIKL